MWVLCALALARREAELEAPSPNALFARVAATALDGWRAVAADALAGRSDARAPLVDCSAPLSERAPHSDASAARTARAIERAIECGVRARTDCVLSHDVDHDVPFAAVLSPAAGGVDAYVDPRVVHDGCADHETTRDCAARRAESDVLVVDRHGAAPAMRLNRTALVEFLRAPHARPAWATSAAERDAPRAAERAVRLLRSTDAMCVQLLIEAESRRCAP